jgi:hypothetical protein
MPPGQEPERLGISGPDAALQAAGVSTQTFEGG